jgi:hypothetical protein
VLQADDGGVLVPFCLRLTAPVRLMLLTLRDDPVYADLEVQWARRPDTGKEGMVLIAVRRRDGSADVLVQSGLGLSRADYEIAAGLASFSAASFEPARFDITAAGVHVDLGVRLPDGRHLTLSVHEARTSPRPLVRMLAPAGQSMTSPAFFPFFWMDDIWFLRWRGARVAIAVDGAPRSVLRVGAPWRLARYAVAPMTALWCEQQSSVSLIDVGDEPGCHDVEGTRVHVGAGPALQQISVTRDERSLGVTFDPPVPDIATLDEGRVGGRFTMWADGRAQLGGHYTMSRSGQQGQVRLDVDQPWDPGPQPAVAAAVFRLLSVFRTWPTTYRWDASVDLGSTPAVITSGWTRVPATGGGSGPV